VVLLPLLVEQAVGAQEHRLRDQEAALQRPLAEGLVENDYENDDDFDDAVRTMRDSVAGRFAPPPAAPPSVAGRLPSALRGLFGSGVASSSSSSNP
jgi:hypothetical protein